MKKYFVLLIISLFTVSIDAAVFGVPTTTPDGIGSSTNTVGNDDVIIVDFGEDITPYLESYSDAYISIGSKMIYSGLGKFWDTRVEGENNFIYSNETSIVTINSANQNQLLINLSTISITDGSSITITLSEGCVYSESNPTDYNQVQVLSYKGEVPSLYIKSPSHTQDNVLTNDTVILTFSARVFINTGAPRTMSIVNTTDNVTIWNVTSNTTIPIANAATTKVSVSGNKVTLRVNSSTPITFLPNKNYKVVMDAGFFRSKTPPNGSEVAAILDGTYSFSTKEITASSFFPVDGTLNPPGASISADYSVTFNTNIVAGRDSVRIFKTGVTKAVDVIPISACTISGATLTIPHISLEGNTDYNIRMDKKIVKSSTTNAYFKGIYDATTWNFKTQASNTWDGGANDNDFLNPVNYVNDVYYNTMPVTIGEGDVAILSSDETIPELVITSNGRLEIASGATLTVSGKVSLMSASASNSSLIINGALSVAPSNIFIYQYASVTSPSSLKKGYAIPVTSITGTAANFKNPIVQFNNSTALYENVPLSSTLLPTVGYASYATTNLVFSGTINNNADYDLTLKYTSDPGASSIYSSAYNFFGNPYLAPINWSKMWSELSPTDTTKVRQTCWVLEESGNWRTINGISGIASDGGEGVIPRGHAFMLRAKPGVGGGDATSTLKLKKSDLVSSSKSLLKSISINVKPEIIRFSGLSDGYSSDIVFGFHPESNSSYDIYDSEYQSFPITSASYDKRLQIASYLNTTPIVINTQPLIKDTVEYLVAYYVKTAGTYSIKLSNIDPELLTNGARVFLTDTVQSKTVEMFGNDIYMFYSSATASVVKNRFKVKIVFSDNILTSNTPPSTTKKTTASLYYSNSNIHINLANDELSYVDVYSTNGELVLHQVVSGSKAEVPFEGNGVYIVKVVGQSSSSAIKIIAN